MPSKPSVRFVSLGCPKNLVDSEVMLGHLTENADMSSLPVALLLYPADNQQS